MNDEELEAIVNDYLEEKSLEDFIEEFNITPQEVVQLLYEEGMLSDDLLSRMRPADV